VVGSMPDDSRASPKLISMDLEVISPCRKINFEQEEQYKYPAQEQFRCRIVILPSRTIGTIAGLTSGQRKSSSECIYQFVEMSLSQGKDKSTQEPPVFFFLVTCFLFLL
jgi:hypothetical protein